MDALACGFQDAVRIISLTSLPVSRSCDMCTVLESRPEIYHKQHLLDKEKKRKKIIIMITVTVIMINNLSTNTRTKSVGRNTYNI